MRTIYACLVNINAEEFTLPAPSQVIHAEYMGKEIFVYYVGANSLTTKQDTYFIVKTGDNIHMNAGEFQVIVAVNDSPRFIFKEKPTL